MSPQTTDLRRWSAFHRDPKQRKDLKPFLRESWERCDAYKVDYLNAEPAKVPEDELRQIKQVTKRLYIYTSSIILPMNLQKLNDRVGALLFDKNGTLLRMFGGETFTGWMRENGVESGTRWTEETIGTNAVSLGEQMEQVVTVRAEQHYARFLTFGDFTYAPIKLENGDPYGGIVLATPANLRFENGYALAVMLARAIELQLFWFEAVFVYGSITEGSGVLCLDQSNDENRILLISEESIRLLGLEKRDHFYEKLEKLIDPLPANKPFWDIVNNKLKVVDKTITLRIRGEESIISVSATPYQEEKFHMRGISINFNSLQRINKLVSKFSGNAARYHFEDVIGESEPLQDVIRRAKTVSFTDSNILLQGESGVGKDIIAQAIHNNSRRRDKPFVALNCAAFSKDLITSELFGYERGAFTGAKKEGAMGKFELANRGTLFLDEIGDMPLDLQAVLLRVVEEKSFMRVGGTEMIHVNVRLIAATNQTLQHKIDQGLFREDLYYRLGTLRLTIPPLRKRGDDVLTLADHFAAQICARLGKTPVRFTPAAQDFMRRYKWPGNVRELQNMLEGVISTNEDAAIGERAIREFLGDSDELPAALPPDTGFVNTDGRFIVKGDIEAALKACHNNKVKAAEYLGIGRSTLYKWMRIFHMQ